MHMRRRIHAYAEEDVTYHVDFCRTHTEHPVAHIPVI
jgi:hypothetical protein